MLTRKIKQIAVLLFSCFIIACTNKKSLQQQSIVSVDELKPSNAEGAYPAIGVFDYYKNGIHYIICESTLGGVEIRNYTKDSIENTFYLPSPKVGVDCDIDSNEVGQGLYNHSKIPSK